MVLNAKSEPFAKNAPSGVGVVVLMVREWRRE
jgi:hypothetical protein